VAYVVVAALAAATLVDGALDDVLEAGSQCTTAGCE